MEFNFKIKGDKLIGGAFLDGNSGSINVYSCSFEIPENDNFIWICVFRNEKGTYQQAIVDGKCVIPQEVLGESGTFKIGCYGTLGDKRISTNWLEFSVKEGAYCEGTQPCEPTPDLWETLVMNSLPYIGASGNWYVYDKKQGEYKDSGKPARGEKGDKGDKGDRGTDGYTPQRYVDYWTDEDRASVKEDLEKDLNFEARLAKVVGNTGNSIKKNVTGEIILLDDASPMEHLIEMNIKSKNIAYDCVYNNTTATNENTAACYANLYKGKTYTLSIQTENTGATIKVLTHQRPITLLTNANIVCDGERKSVTFTMTDDFVRNYRVTWLQLVSGASSGLCSNLQIEEGFEATAYTENISDLSTVKMLRFGENLFNPALIVERTQTGITTTLQADGGILFSGTATGTTRMAHSTEFAEPIILPAGTYSSYGNYVEIVLKSMDGTSSRWANGTFTITEPMRFTNLAFNKLVVGNEYNEVIYPSLVVGNVPKQAEYVEVASYPASSGGTVENVTAITPVMTLIADKAGVNMDCQYKRDINKALEELKNAIISLGGNV